jgi:hypothetical protein
VPLLLHVCGILVPVKHCFVPGLQMPPQTPAPWQTLGQTMLSIHWPMLLQSCAVVLLLAHRLVPGLHEPPQAAVPPGTQTFGHATPHHLPVASQVSSVLPVHRVEFGLQEPMHPPLLQTY